MTKRTEIKIYEKPYLKYARIIILILFLACTIFAATMYLILEHYLMGIIAIAFSIFFIGILRGKLRELKQHNPVVVFRKSGITNQYGSYLSWGDVRKVSMRTDVLSVWGSSIITEFLQIRQSRISKEQFSLALEIIKEKVPQTQKKTGN